MTFVPGMLGAVAGFKTVVIPPLLGITEASYNGSDGGSISWPAGRQVGDVAVLFDLKYTLSGSSGSYSVPSGFTELAAYDPSMNGGTQSFAASYRLLDGSESGSISGMGGGLDQHKHLALYRGTNRAILKVAANGFFAIGSNNPPPTNINATIGPAPKAVFGWLSFWGVGNFSSQTPAFATQNNRSTDVPGSGNDDWVSRFYRTLYQPGDTLFNHTVDYNASAIMAGGQLTFS